MKTNTYFLATSTVNAKYYNATKRLKNANITLYWVCFNGGEMCEASLCHVSISGSKKDYSKAEKRLIDEISPIDEFEYFTMEFETDELTKVIDLQSDELDDAFNEAKLFLFVTR